MTFIIEEGTTGEVREGIAFKYELLKIKLI